MPSGAIFHLPKLQSLREDASNITVQTVRNDVISDSLPTDNPSKRLSDGLSCVSSSSERSYESSDEMSAIDSEEEDDDISRESVRSESQPQQSQQSQPQQSQPPHEWRKDSPRSTSGTRRSIPLPPPTSFPIIISPPQFTSRPPPHSYPYPDVGRHIRTEASEPPFQRDVADGVVIQHKGELPMYSRTFQTGRPASLELNFEPLSADCLPPEKDEKYISSTLSLAYRQLLYDAYLSLAHMSIERMIFPAEFLNDLSELYVHGRTPEQLPALWSSADPLTFADHLLSKPLSGSFELKSRTTPPVISRESDDAHVTSPPRKRQKVNQKSNECSSSDDCIDGLCDTSDSGNHSSEHFANSSKTSPSSRTEKPDPTADQSEHILITRSDNPSPGGDSVLEDRHFNGRREPIIINSIRSSVDSVVDLDVQMSDSEDDSLQLLDPEEVEFCEHNTVFPHQGPVRSSKHSTMTDRHEVRKVSEDYASAEEGEIDNSVKTIKSTKLRDLTSPHQTVPTLVNLLQMVGENVSAFLPDDSKSVLRQVMEAHAENP